MDMEPHADRITTEQTGRSEAKLMIFMVFLLERVIKKVGRFQRRYSEYTPDAQSDAPVRKNWFFNRERTDQTGKDCKAAMQHRNKGCSNNAKGFRSPDSA
jgi:hypothetical protein